MKLRSKITGHVFDVPREEALALIKLGNVEEVVPKIPQVVGDLKWAARPGVIEGDYQHPPIIQTSCSACGHKGYTESKKGTAHTHEVRHCGVMRVDRCPEDVAAKYLQLFAEWKSRSRKPVEEKISASTPPVLNARFGLKSREELIREAVIGAKRYPSGGNHGA